MSRAVYARCALPEVGTRPALGPGRRYHPVGISEGVVMSVWRSARRLVAVAAASAGLVFVAASTPPAVPRSAMWACSVVRTPPSPPSAITRCPTSGDCGSPRPKTIRSPTIGARTSWRGRTRTDRDRRRGRRSMPCWRANPQTSSVWFQVCVRADAPGSTATVDTIVDLIRDRLPAATIYASALDDTPTCMVGDPETSQTYVDHLVDTGQAVRGPTMSPLPADQVKGCHASGDGLTLHGTDLASYFDDGVAPGPPHLHRVRRRARRLTCSPTTSSGSPTPESPVDATRPTMTSSAPTIP